MRSFGLWLMSVTVLSMSLGCGDGKAPDRTTEPGTTPPVDETAPPVDDPTADPDVTTP